MEDDGILSTGAPVALRKESVDRNIRREISLMRPYVALRKESVDRNDTLSGTLRSSNRSLSARRAWIEIFSRTAPRSTN